MPDYPSAFDRFSDYPLDEIPYEETVPRRRPAGSSSGGLRSGSAPRRASPAPKIWDAETQEASTAGVITVGTAVARLQGVVNGLLAGVWISGEVSNLSRPASGHVYFTLKDGDAQLRCAYFAGAARRRPAVFRIGDKIEVRGQIDIYARSGDLQIKIADWRHAGMGALYEAYLHLKEKLREEGVFDAERKKRLPHFLRRAVVVTSEQAAALQDVIRTVRRRTPWIRLTLLPAYVQGDEAPESLIRALRRADGLGADAILLVRGGGSFEDLMAFNDETLVRTISMLETPVIAGIGHESDETLASLAADVCASTPTAAAEQLGADERFWREQFDTFERRLTVLTDRRLDEADQTLDYYDERLGTVSQVIGEKAGSLGRLSALLSQLAASGLADRAARLSRSAARLQGPDAVLEAKVAALKKGAAALDDAMMRTMQSSSEMERKAGARLDAAVERTLSWREKEFALAGKRLPDPQQLLAGLSERLRGATRTLAALDPERPLRSGYALVRRGDTVIARAGETAAGEALTVTFADGAADVVVSRTVSR